MEGGKPEVHRLKNSLSMDETLGTYMYNRNSGGRKEPSQRPHDCDQNPGYNRSKRHGSETYYAVTRVINSQCVTTLGLLMSFS